MKKQEKFDKGLSKLIFDSISDLIFIVDENFVITKVNKAFADMLKSKPEDIIGKKCYKLLHKSNKPWPECPFNMVKKDKKTHTQEVNDPNIAIPLLITASPIFDNKGKLIGGIHIARDITEQKKAEQTIKESEKKFRTLVENLPQKIFFKDKNSVYISCNKNYAKDLRIKQEEIAGKTDFEFYPKKLAKKYRADDKRIMKSGKIEDIEEQYVYDGEKAIVHTVKTPVKDEKGNVVGILGIFWDITERKKAEEALRENEEKYRRLFEGANDLVQSVGPDGMLIDVNPKWREVMGYSEKEALKMNLMDIIHPRSQKHCMELFKKILSGKSVKDIKAEFVTKKGKVIIVNGSASCILKSGKPNVTWGIFRDITAEKEMEESLRESEEKNRTLVENLPQKIFFKDKNSVYISCNKNYAKDLRIKQEEIAGKTDFEFYPKKLAKKYRADDKRIMKSGKIEDIEEQYVYDGEKAFVHMVKTPVKDEKGNVVGILGIFWDITEKKKTEEEIRKKTEEMEKFSKFAVDRELKMVELKKKIRRLERQLGER